MSALLYFLGFVSAIALMISGFLFVFAPDAANRLLKSLGAALTIILFAWMLIDELLRALNSFALIFCAITVSALAYFIREHRLGHYKSNEGARYAERSPIMPSHVSEEDEQ